MDKRCAVVLSKLADKQLKRLPHQIKEAALVWAESVEEDGIRKVRQLPGYHDEPLVGERRGQRSVRLNRAYRLFYQEDDTGTVTFILVQEVNKHEY